MPRHRSALKRLRVDKKRHLHNLRIKQQLKKTIKKFQALLLAKNINESRTFDKVRDEAKVLLGKVYSQLDKAVKKRIMHPNTAKRKKSRLTKKLLKVT
jgi:small subunit ribosomal protein S20